jgi:hypothetical protein
MDDRRVPDRECRAGFGEKLEFHTGFTARVLRGRGGGSHALLEYAEQLVRTLVPREQAVQQKAAAVWIIHPSRDPSIPRCVSASVYGFPVSAFAISSSAASSSFSRM